ncbi:putative oxidoreductase-like protein [Ilyonectria robusta]
MADIELIARFSIASSAPYSISKAGMNVAVAKFSAEYSKDGVLFLSISPGLSIRTTRSSDHLVATEDQIKGGQQMMAQFAEYAPHFKGPTTAESSVKNVLSVINQKSVEAGDGGSFVSHFGNKQWL